jgi:L-seryl-tRNA(Ser) seleniumtransferase
MGVAPELPRGILLGWIREVLDTARQRIRDAAAAEDAEPLPGPDRDAWIDWALAELGRRRRRDEAGALRRVINLTGVLLHTNLGRAPFCAAATEAALGAATGYSSLEMDLVSGARRSRLAPIRELLPQVTGAEAGIAVHNTAAAVFLVLQALAVGKEVIVSRSQLVEIGGSFRLPDIMEAAGVRLVEVGSTNRTRISDYEKKIGPDTALVLKVHPSNFRIVGFTEEASTAELAGLCRERGVPFFEDLGSGALDQHRELTFDEPRVQKCLEDGADLVAFSGDKLLGGPQAGILVGRSALISQLGQHPVARIVRLDKIALAELEATLRCYLDPDSLRGKIPFLRLMSRTTAELTALAEELGTGLIRTLGPPWSYDLVDSIGEVGGGSLPGVELASKAVHLSHPEFSPDSIARAFREADPPVVGRIEKDRFLLDVRSLLEGESADVWRAAEGLRR